MGAYDPMPVHGDGDLNSQPWDPWLRGAIGSLDSRVTHMEQLSPAAAGTGTAGMKNLEEFRAPGTSGPASDTQMLKDYITYSNQQTYKPAGRAYGGLTWNGPINGSGAPGVTILGPDAEREYKASTSYKGMAASIKCHISTTSSSGYFWGMSADWPAPTIRGIHFDGGNQGHDFIQTPASSGNKVLIHSAWDLCGFTNYRHVLNVLVQGGSLAACHFNSNGGHAAYLQGADFAFGSIGRWTYIDNGGSGLASTRWGLDGSVVCGLYITPTGAGCAVEVDRGSGTSFGFLNLDSAGQRLTIAEQCQGALIQLRGGTTEWGPCRLYGGMHNPAGGAGGVAYNKAMITVTGGTHNGLGNLQIHTIKGRNYGSMPSYPGDGSYPSGVTPITSGPTDHLYVGANARVYGFPALTDDTTLGASTADVLRLTAQGSASRIVTTSPPIKVV